jgi:DNA-binding HxlR family transcriptional regulator
MEDSGFNIDAIDEIIHGRVRLGVMACLLATGTAEFGDLKRQLNVTDGNLSTHLRKLEDAGFVAVEKTYAGRKPLTRVALTEQGRKAFIDYLDAMNDLLGGLQG